MSRKQIVENKERWSATYEAMKRPISMTSTPTKKIKMSIQSNNAKGSVYSSIAPSLAVPMTIEIDVTEGLRSLVLDDEEEDDDTTPEPQSPMIVVTPPPEEPSARRQQLRRPSDDVVYPPSRPKLERKAATAPPGVLELHSRTKPQPPRRAISERTKRTDRARERRHRRNSRLVAPVLRLGHLGAPTTRSIISRKMTSRKSIGKMGLKPKAHVSRLSQRTPAQYQLVSEMLSGDRIEVPVEGKSFSEKTRVKETLDRKKMDPLRTSFVDFTLKDLPGTPGSMVATPQELYRGPSTSAPSQRTPPGGSPGLLESSPLPPAQVTRSPVASSRAKHFSLPLTPHVQCRGSLKRSSSEARVKVKAAERRVYIPGPIRLEEKNAATPRKGSIATMDPFDETKPRVKRFSDMVALDKITYFFQDLGVVAESAEDCLDRYWVEDEGAGRGTAPVDAADAPPPMLRHTGRLSSSLAPSPPARQQQHGERRSAETIGRRRLRSLLKSGWLTG